MREHSAEGLKDSRVIIILCAEGSYGTRTIDQKGASGAISCWLSRFYEFLDCIRHIFL